MVQGASPAAADDFPDGFFDFIYLDARHDYTSVMIDLLTFWPKLRKDGLFAGHDFRNAAKLADGNNDWIIGPDGERHPEEKAVRGAVHDFSTMVDRQVVITWEDQQYPSWIMRK